MDLSSLTLGERIVELARLATAVHIDDVLRGAGQSPQLTVNDGSSFASARFEKNCIDGESPLSAQHSGRIFRAR